MRIHNIYVDDAGETHWRDIEVQWVEERNGSKLSARLPATGIIFRETAGGRYIPQVVYPCVIGIPDIRWKIIGRICVSIEQIYLRIHACGKCRHLHPIDNRARRG